MILSRYVPVDLSGHRVVVAGASVAGLATALALGERGAEVVVLDADPAPTASDPDEAFASWTRKRVPQFRHSHAFLARVRNIVMKAYPEIYEELLSAGARELRLLDFPPPALRPLEPLPGDEDLAALGCRRAVFEWVVRRWIERNGIATFETESVVTGLVAEAGERPHVTGVRYDRAGESRTMDADFVVDATGRGSKAAAWLRAIGAGEPSEEKSSSSVLYYTRFYRLRPGMEFPMPGDEPTMADYGWVKFAIFPADSRTFSITFATPVALPRLKILADGAAFDRMIAALPGLVPFTSPELAEPITLGDREVLAMGGLENCRRRFVDGEGRPLAPGFFVIGDAAYHTNPLYGRGCTQAFIHASLLGEALDATAGDVDAAGAMLDQSARVEIEPFYRASVLADYGAARKAERYRRLEKSAGKDDASPSSLVDRLADSFFEEGVIVASRVDPVVFRAFVRMFNMMDTPDDAFASPELIGRITSVWMRGRRLRERHLPKGPPAEATIVACERAAGVTERATA